jgi:hypothetical protein
MENPSPDSIFDAVGVGDVVGVAGVGGDDAVVVDVVAGDLDPLRGELVARLPRLTRNPSMVWWMLLR